MQTSDEIRKETEPLNDWAKSLSDDQISAVIHEARYNRCAAIAYYDAGELETMFDDGRDFSDFLNECRDELEEVMCEAAREYANRCVPEVDDHE